MDRITLQKDNPNKIENLVINVDLSKKPIGQLDNTTVLSAEVFRFNDPTKFSDIILGVHTDLYLDMLLDIMNIKQRDELSVYFSVSVEDNYDRVVRASENKEYLMFFDGMLSTLDKDFNEKIIRESYYE